MGLPDAPVAPGLAVSGGDAIVTADFNGDGLVDIATSSTSSYNHANNISVLLATGNNAFANHVDYPTGDTPGGIVATDWDGDGHIDIVATNPNANAVSVLFNQGNGTFAPKVDMAVGAKLWRLVAADVNDDGLDDLVATASAPTIALVVLTNTGGGAYTFADYFTGSNPRAIRTADVNGDGKTDIVAANSGGSVSVFMYNGDGTQPTPGMAGARHALGMVARWLQSTTTTTVRSIWHLPIAIGAFSNCIKTSEMGRLGLALPIR